MIPPTFKYFVPGCSIIPGGDLRSMITTSSVSVGKSSKNLCARIFSSKNVKIGAVNPHRPLLEVCSVCRKIAVLSF